LIIGFANYFLCQISSGDHAKIKVTDELHLPLSDLKQFITEELFGSKNVYKNLYSNNIELYYSTNGSKLKFLKNFINLKDLLIRIEYTSGTFLQNMVAF
jgi:hypothetical protein